jgi:hypothetical protein
VDQKTKRIILINRLPTEFDTTDDWVLPKGAKRWDETAEICASRRITETSGVFCRLLPYVLAHLPPAAGDGGSAQQLSFTVTRVPAVVPPSASNGPASTAVAPFAYQRHLYGRTMMETAWYLFEGDSALEPIPTEATVWKDLHPQWLEYADIRQIVMDPEEREILKRGMELAFGPEYWLEAGDDDPFGA